MYDYDTILPTSIPNTKMKVMKKHNNNNNNLKY